MCVLGCREVVFEKLSRRGFFNMAAATTAATITATHIGTKSAKAQNNAFSKVIDMTHTLSDRFPTFFGTPGIEMEKINEFGKDGYNVLKWNLVEHCGTHMDAPIHFSADQDTIERIDPENLVIPLVVVNVKEKAEQNPDYQLTPDDVKKWTQKYGEIPPKACVAMNSGWDKNAKSDKFRNTDENGTMHFPGFHKETADMMIKAGATGMAVDTLSLDTGNSKDFSTHYLWLPSGRWGVECIANLDSVPENGAILVVGAPKIKGATGGPSRIFALI